MVSEKPLWMPKDTLVFAVVFILSAVGLAGTWIWSTHHRYRLVDATRARTPSERHVYELDKRTGGLWIVTPAGKKAVPAPEGCFWEVNSEGKHLRWEPGP
jgi:hypothetical protein